MNKNAQQEMDLSNLQVPAKPMVIGKSGQVVEPPLIKALDDHIVEYMLLVMKGGPCSWPHG